MAQSTSLPKHRTAERVHEAASRLAAPGLDRAAARQLIRERAEAMTELIRTDPAQALAAGLPPAQAAQWAAAAPEAAAQLDVWGEWRGPAQVVIEDDFERGTSRKTWRLYAEGIWHEVHFAQDAPEPGCGQQLTVRGLKVEGVVAAAESAVSADVAALTTCSTTGDQKVAVLLVAFPNQALPAVVTPSLVQNAFFGTSGRSLNTYWQEASYGQASASGGVFGPFVLDANYGCDQTDAIRSAAIRAADSTVDFRNYNRLFLIVPRNNNSCSLGLGTIGCNTLFSPSKGAFTSSTTWMRADYLTTNDAVVSVAAHEGGHNIGLDHASTLDFGSVPLSTLSAAGTLDEYGDIFSAMGLSYNVGGQTIVGHYASPHKQSLGWLTGGRLQQVETTATLTLGPYEPANAGVQAVRVRRGAGNNQWLWLEYRQSQGLFDPTLSLYSSTAYSGALIHLENPALSQYGSRSLLLDYHPTSAPNDFRDAALRPGESWKDPYSDLTVRVNSATAVGLSVSFTYGSLCAVLSPTSRSHGDGAEFGFVGVTASPDCSWVAASNASWILITGGGSGSGNGSVSYSLTPNPNTSPRTGTITVGGQTFTITQAGAPISNPASAKRAGVFRGGFWYFDLNGNGLWEGAGIDRVVQFGVAGDVPVTGDWTGNGITKIGVFRAGTWYLDLNGNGQWDGPVVDRAVQFGLAGDVPVTGDWNGDGKTEIGVFRAGYWFLDFNGNGYWEGAAVDRLMQFGAPGDRPVVGDWTGTGSVRVGVFRSGMWYLDLNGSGFWEGQGIDRAFAFGVPTDQPIVGDWTGTGGAKAAVFRGGYWYLDQNDSGQWDDAPSDRAFRFGGLGDIPVVGIW